MSSLSPGVGPSQVCWCLLLFIDHLVHLVVHLNPDIEHLVVYCTVGGTWPTAVCPASQAGPYKALRLTPIDPGNK